ncbi:MULTISPECIES: hypothetical protein [Paenibacillus]|uniref:hypothetical protein n=1 Tax=Paenibacillus TaxID=44249 RepID=UPI00076D2840|nr:MULTISPECIES: hypothetical protein [Paenibacillus]KUP21975.1 hypothetical protein AWJ19_06060 [Paenibacillus sp. DMB5]MBY0013990.1 hypothetical protein [Paenibacillus typhae]MDF9843117.1 hypothetical protein [Paenibacillus sp. PastF-2]MDF9849671.1 hypothetical protein [Paenibacillus sp. PastM-2]MDF9856411.1 hypothetical protein [Paenibacillus sp. PastF-1]
MKNMKGVVSLSGAVRRSAGGSSGTSRSRGRKNGGRTARPSAASDHVYLAPSVNGGDEEYKKLVSGKVDNKKPSFA